MLNHMRLFLVAILIVTAILFLFASCNAEGERLETRRDFIRVIEMNTIQGVNEYKFQLSSELFSDIKTGMKDWVNDAFDNCGVINYKYSLNEFSKTLNLTSIEYRVAVRILQAYCSGNLSWLTSRERQTLDRAIEIVKGAPFETLARERYLHDMLCSLVKYETNHTTYEENDQAIGALLNGKADCDGYSEAFYLLCNLAGISTRFQHGDTYEKTEITESDDATHMWNLVCVYDTWLMVDVTWDDSSNDDSYFYLYYNIGTERAKETHIWDSSILAVPWSSKSSNTLRPIDVVEGYVTSIAEAEKYLRDILINTHSSRVALNYSRNIDLMSDKNLFRNWIYSTGVNQYRLKTGGHCIEIHVTEWDTECQSGYTFKVCENEAEIISFIDNSARYAYANLQLYIPGKYGESLFANNANLMFSILDATLLMNSSKISYSKDIQTCYIKNANYWPKKNKAPIDSLDAYMRKLLVNKPQSVAVWTDGTYKWNDSLIKQLYLSVYRAGVESYQSIKSPEKIEFTKLDYPANYCMVDTEDELLSYLRDCRSRSLSSFAVYCSKSLYDKLSANQFDRFFSITKNILKQGQSISYSSDSYRISMKNVKYK